MAGRGTKVRRLVLIIIGFFAGFAMWTAGWGERGDTQIAQGSESSVLPVQSAAGGGTWQSNVDLLARVIAAEARGEPYIGKVAVGAVVLNRVKHPEFPNTLAGVIYQPHAFESVTNGLIWRRTPTAEERQAAVDALNGWDPTYGSIFFWNPSKPVSPWIWSRPIVVAYGNHVFAR